jgi:integrase
MNHRSKSGGYIDPRRAERLLSEVADAWRETWTDLEPKTRAGYDHILRKHIIGTADAPGRFHRARVGAVSTATVQRYVNEISGSHAPNTVRRIFSVLRSVLRVAVERRYIAVNPCDAVKLPRKSKGRTKPKRILFLNPPEVRALADAMPRPGDRLAVYVAAYCGVRAGELWALTRKDVDLLHGTLAVECALK